MFSQSQLSFQTTQEDHKASYDDLTDDHAVHQPFSVEAPYHKSTPSKQSGHTSHASYPPLAPTRDVDSRPFWEKVPPSFIHHARFFLTLHAFPSSYLNLWRVDSTFSQSLSKQQSTWRLKGNCSSGCVGTLRVPKKYLPKWPSTSVLSPSPSTFSAIV